MILISPVTGSTFGGGPFACRAGFCVLDELDGGLQEHIGAIGALLQTALDVLGERHDVLTERRGLGLMQGVVAPGLSTTIVEHLFTAGVLTCTAADDVVRFLPPYVLTFEDLDTALERLDSVLAEISAASS